MKRNMILLAALLVVCLLTVSLYAWFHVSGREIDGVSSMGVDCSVRIRKGLDEYQEYALDSLQRERLTALLSGSSFTRRLSGGTVTYPSGEAYYTILIDFHNGQDFLTIHSISNRYISIADQFGGRHLKINNPQWETTLNDILSHSTAVK